MKKLFYIAVTLFFSNLNNIYTQTNNSKYDNAWILGYEYSSPIRYDSGVKLSFDGDTAKIDTFYMFASLGETNASICDRHGNLQFYTEGIRLFNKAHDLMPHGDTLCPGGIYEYIKNDFFGIDKVQGAIFLPFSSDSSIYKLFHLELALHNISPVFGHKLYCTTLDSKLNNGLGAIITKSKLVIQDSLTRNCITACRHANGKDWWLLIPGIYNHKYHKVLMTQDSMYHSVQVIGSLPNKGGQGQACFSPNGCYYALYQTTYDRVNSQLCIYNFNRTTGGLSNPIQIPVLDSSYLGGVAISPNSRFLYASSLFFVYQFDLWASDVAASKITVATYDGFIDPLWWGGGTAFMTAQLAPDGKIYISTPGSTHYIHVIEYPDRLGLACELRQHTIRIPRYYASAMPNFPNYRLGALQASDSCPSLISASSDAPAEAPLGLVVQPNPTTDLLHIAYYTENTTAISVAISDYTGKKLQTLSLDSAIGSLDINTSALPNGLYLCTLYDSATHRQQSVKFVVMR